MKVNLLPKIPKTSVKFTSSKKEKNTDAKYKNPINSKMEYLSATVATISSGLAFAVYFLGDFVDDIDMNNFAQKTGRKFMPKAHPLIRYAVVLLGAIGILSALYCTLKLPKNLYSTKVETYKKQKEMDVYIRANSAEKKLTERIDEEAKNADSQKKQNLATDYIKLRSAKNNVPYFISTDTLRQIEKMQSKN